MRRLRRKNCDVAFAREAIMQAARYLGITLHSDDEIIAEADATMARVDREIERLQRAGELRSVNQSYRSYRLEASARGERVMRYQDWMRNYRENMMRQVASSLRYL